MPGPGSPCGGHTVKSALAEAAYWRSRALACASVGSLIYSSPYSMRLSKAVEARTWQYFWDHGSQHSGRAASLTYILNRCEREGVAYELIALPGKGYYIRRVEEV